jgi:hypothetical protein
MVKYQIDYRFSHPSESGYQPRYQPGYQPPSKCEKNHTVVVFGVKKPLKTMGLTVVKTSLLKTEGQ